MAKQFTYRGKSIEDLKKMSLDEVIKLLPARARRSINRGQLKKNQRLYKRIIEARKAVDLETQQKVIKTHRRDFIILPIMIGLKINVHNGKEFNEVLIKPEMIGHPLGEYALTRRMVKHSTPGVGASRSSKFVPVK
jgi:small subunit ribosomal protein S19